jgi:hypothetical protein
LSLGSEASSKIASSSNFGVLYRVYGFEERRKKAHSAEKIKT